MNKRHLGYYPLHWHAGIRTNNHLIKLCKSFPTWLVLLFPFINEWKGQINHRSTQILLLGTATWPLPINAEEQRASTGFNTISIKCSLGSLWEVLDETGSTNMRGNHFALSDSPFTATIYVEYKQLFKKCWQWCYSYYADENHKRLLR